MALRDHLEDMATRRQQVLALRHLQAENDDTLAVAHRERRPLLYLGACFNRPYERNNLQVHVIICMRAVAAAARASQVTLNQCCPGADNCTTDLGSVRPCDQCHDPGSFTARGCKVLD